MSDQPRSTSNHKYSQMESGIIFFDANRKSCMSKTSLMKAHQENEDNKSETKGSSPISSHDSPDLHIKEGMILFDPKQKSHITRTSSLKALQENEDDKSETKGSSPISCHDSHIKQGITIFGPKQKSDIARTFSLKARQGNEDNKFYTKGSSPNSCLEETSTIQDTYTTALRDAATKDVLQEDNGRERLKRHRSEVAGRVWIPDIWGQEKLLKDWIDCSAFESSFIHSGIMSARAALVKEARTANSRRLRIENRC